VQLPAIHQRTHGLRFVHQLLKLNLRGARTTGNWFVLHSGLPYCWIATEPSNQHQLIWSVDRLINCYWHWVPPGMIMIIAQGHLGAAVCENCIIFLFPRQHPVGRSVGRSTSTLRFLQLKLQCNLPGWSKAITGQFGKDLRHFRRAIRSSDNSHCNTIVDPARIQIQSQADGSGACVSFGIICLAALISR